MNSLSTEYWVKLKEKEEILRRACEILRVQEEHLPRTIQRFLEEIREMKLKLNQSSTS
ncbi:MAG: hypothetical protein QXY40_07165 [Candidatus Methanomethylicia archaeon]